MKVLFGETSTDTLDAKEKIKTVNWKGLLK